MSIIQEIKELIIESHIFPDKTMSVDLHKFESDEANKLIILAPINISSGNKSAKKYNAQFINDEIIYNNSDELNFLKNFLHEIVSTKKQVISSIQFAYIYNEETYDYYDYRINDTVFLNNSFIFFKNSTLKQLLVKYKFKDIDNAIKIINKLKKDRCALSGSIIKEFNY